jgi:spectrin beta
LHKIFINFKKVKKKFPFKSQLQDLNKQSELLRQQHPGDTAESVSAEMEELIERFRDVWLMAEQRSADLKQALEFFKFIACVKDVNEWMDETRKSLLAKPQLHDLFTVTQCRQELDNLSYEMTHRDDIFKDLDIMCVQLVSEQNHPNKKEILSQTNKAMNERELLFRLWKLKCELLETQFECHTFYREAAQLIGAINSQESLLSKAYNELHQQLDQKILIGVEDLESSMKAHENLSKKIEKQSVDNVAELQRVGEQLIEKESKRLHIDETQSIFDMNELERLEETIAQILRKDRDVHELSSRRLKQLSEAMMFSKLRRDVDEFEIWIDEKMRQARSLSAANQKLLGNASGNELISSDKVKLFQKHKALFSDMEANESRYNDLVKRGQEQVKSNKTIKALQVKQIIDELSKKWKDLEFESRERAKEFEEAKDVLEFNDQLEQLEDWLKDKELMLQNGDTGRDYEHCVGLIKKAEEAVSTANEQKLQAVILMGDRLIFYFIIRRFLMNFIFSFYFGS